MSKSLLAGFCAATIFVNICSLNVNAIDAENLPLNENIVLYSKCGKIFIHMQNKGSLDILLDKTELEGVFTFYDTVIENADDTEKTFVMELSKCEFLEDKMEYVSYYTLNFKIPSDDNAACEQTIIIKDPDCDTIKGSEYHYYITLKLSDKSGCKVTDEKEETTKDSIYICSQYLEISYTVTAGDVNGDCILDLSDATAVLGYYANKASGITDSSFTQEQEKAADINADGVIDIADATQILTIYAKNAAGIK